MTIEELKIKLAGQFDHIIFFEVTVKRNDYPTEFDEWTNEVLGDSTWCPHPREEVGIWKLMTVEEYEDLIDSCHDYEDGDIILVCLDDTRNAEITDLDVLTALGYSEKEAKEKLEKGKVTVYSDLEEYLDGYIEEWYSPSQGWDIEDEETQESIAKLRKMVETKEAYEDWDVIELYGETFFVSYVL